MWSADAKPPQSIEALVAASYEAAFDEAGDCGWCALLAQLCEHFGAAAGGLLLHDFARRESTLRHKFGADAADELGRTGGRFPAMPLPDATHLNGHGANAANRAPCATVSTQLTGVISNEAGQVCWISLVRPPDGHAFNAGQQVTFAHLLPHFRRSLGLRSTLARDRVTQATLASIMDLLPVAMLRVDRTGRVHFRNQAAIDLMADDAGIVLRRDGTIGTGLPGATEHLRKSIARVAVDKAAVSPSAAGAHCLVPRGAGRLPLICVLYPIESDRAGANGHQEPAVAIAIKDPQATVSDGVDMFQLAFGLTKAEARLIGLLLEGRGLFEAADHLGITRNTARTHMRNIYGKVGVHRQADLIAMVERFSVF